MTFGTFRLYLVMGLGLFKIGGRHFLLWALCDMVWAFWAMDTVIVDVPNMVKPIIGWAKGGIF